ncbi:MAG: ABC transporter ATP-binding protein [Chloroflexota bacterium]
MTALLRIRHFLKPYTWPLVGNLTILLTSTGLALVVPRIMQQVIDVGLKSGNTASLIQSASLLLGIGVTIAVLSLMQRYLTIWIAAHVGYDLRNRMYDHIQYLPFTYHDHAQSGQLISRGIEDIRAIEIFAGSGIVEFLQLFLLTVGILALMASENLKLMLIAILPLLPMVMLGVSLGSRISGMFLAVDNAVGDISARLQENVSGVQVVRAFAREPYEIEQFNKLNRIVFKLWVKVNDQRATVLPASHFLITLGTILVLWIGGGMVLAGQMTVGEVVAFNAYLLMLSNPTQQLTNLINAAGEASAGARRLFDVLDHQPEIQSPAGAISLPPLRGQVELRGVSLKYADEKRESLTGINLRVEPNQLIALIGQTGSGKTSLVNLIPRFYDVTEGVVLVDGHDVRGVELVSLRRQIGIVLQTSLLFSDSIEANIAYGKPEASEEEILAAAKTAQAHEFITGLPQSYDTVVGERGVTLSGGQRQRVAIARALLMDPRILILDDSTSSVDTQTEQAIQKALDKLMEGRTTFVIAHRLATVRRADLILVMDKGRIVQRGTHGELLAQGGLYKKIHDLQLSQQMKFVEEMEEKEAVSAVETSTTREEGF